MEPEASVSAIVFHQRIHLSEIDHFQKGITEITPS